MSPVIAVAPGKIRAFFSLFIPQRELKAQLNIAIGDYNRMLAEKPIVPGKPWRRLPQPISLKWVIGDMRRSLIVVRVTDEICRIFERRGFGERLPFFPKWLKWGAVVMFEAKETGKLGMTVLFDLQEGKLAVQFHSQSGGKIEKKFLASVQRALARRGIRLVCEQTGSFLLTRIRYP